MLALTISAVCLNLLSSSYLVESFVLLTANVEDIKQIAKKFLSESFSDQISEFLTKVKMQDALSEENERNAQEVRGSRELEEAHDNFKYHEEQRSDQFGFNLPLKQDYGDPNEMSQAFMNVIKDPRSLPIKGNNDARFKKRPEKLKIESYVKQDFHRDAERGGFEVKPQSMNRVSATDRVEQPIQPASKHSKRRVHAITTEKHRNEFDQYGHTSKYQNDLVATSGYVVLPRVRAFNTML